MVSKGAWPPFFEKTSRAADVCIAGKREGCRSSKGRRFVASRANESGSIPHQTGHGSRRPPKRLFTGRASITVAAPRGSLRSGGPVRHQYVLGPGGTKRRRTLCERRCSMATPRMFGMVSSLAMYGTKKGRSFMKLAILVARRAAFTLIR
jgi:hypothetical protein